MARETARTSPALICSAQLSTDGNILIFVVPASRRRVFRFLATLQKPQARRRRHKILPCLKRFNDYNEILQPGAKQGS
jgi:hypothetical protein